MSSNIAALVRVLVLEEEEERSVHPHGTVSSPMGVLSHRDISTHCLPRGDPSRRDIELTQVTAQINTIWADKWWTIVQGLWQVDWELNEKTSMTLEFEGGRSLMGRWGIYARPGVAIWGRDVPGAYV